jgi:hypothetical protein
LSFPTLDSVSVYDPPAKQPEEPKNAEPGQVKLAAALALDRIEGKKGRADRVLLAVLRDLKGAEIRREFLESLGAPAMSALTPTLVKAFEEYKEDRRWIVDALAEMGPGAKEALPLLKRVSREGKPELREAAAKAVESITAGSKKRDRR